MGLMTSEMFTAIQEGKPVYPILELDIGGTTKRYGAAPVDVDSLGMYEEKILSWSPISRGVSLIGTSLRSLNTTVEIDDTSRDLDAIVTGEYSRTVAGSAARGKLVSPDVSTDSYFTFYAGAIKDYGKSGPMSYSFELTTLDEPLKGRIQTPTLSKWDFPEAEDDDRDIPVPLVVGEHDSTTVGGPAGMIPCVRARVTPNVEYLITHGLGKDVTQVWVNGAAPGGGTQADFSYTVNGRSYHMIRFTVSSIPVAADVVTVDFDGITEDGTIAGTTITNPAEQLKQIMARWVFTEIQDTSGGFAIPSTTPVDAVSFDSVANFFNIHSIEGSRRLDGTETGESILNEWCNNHSAYAYWNHAGKLAIAVNDWYIDDIYDSASQLKTFTDNDDHGGFRYVYDTEVLADEIAADFLYSSADNKFFRKLRLIDTLRGINRREPRSFHWSRAKI